MKRQIISFSKGLNLNTDPNILPIDYSTMMYGFDHNSGALKLKYVLKNSSIIPQGVHAEIAELDGISRLYYFKKYDDNQNADADKLIIVDTSNAVHYVDLYSLTPSLTSLGITFNNVPEGISYRLNGEDVFIFASEGDNMTVWDGVNSPYTVLDAPKVKSMALHNERLFVTSAENRNRLWFSDDLDPTNWNISMQDAGFIDMCDERGALNKVLSFNGYLYVFRDYGISRLSASGGQEGFYLNHLFISSGKNKESTIALCGDRVIFVASDGVYSFDGLSATKILSNIYPMLLNFEDSKAEFFNGVYYLVCTGDYEGVSDNTILLYSVKDKKFTILRGENIDSLVSVNSSNISSLVLNNAKNTPVLCEIADSTTEGEAFSVFSGVWKHNLTDLADPTRDKVIRGVHIVANKNAVLTIFSENESVSIDIVPDVYSYPCILSGRKFGFTITCDSWGATISDLMIVY